MNCEFETCDRLATRRGMCTAHYTQWRRGGELKPLRPRKDLHKDAKGRVCTDCEVYKPWSDFYKSSRPGGKQAVCIPCMCKAERARGRERRRAGSD